MTERPKPAAGQVWSAPSKNGRRYVRIVAVRERGTDDAYANVLEVSADGEVLKPSKRHPFRNVRTVRNGETRPRPTPFIVKLRGGAMPLPYEPQEETA